MKKRKKKKSDREDISHHQSYVFGAFLGRQVVGEIIISMFNSRNLIY